jgi:hypothetical protein
MVADTSRDSTPAEQPTPEMGSGELAQKLGTLTPSAELQRLVRHSNRFHDLNEAGDIKADSFLQVMFAQLSLPYRDPKGEPYWECTNGAFRMTIQPGILTAKDGSRRPCYPYGVVPRLFLIWLTTEVLQTKSQTVNLGKNLDTLIRNLGFTSGGNQRRKAMEQLRALLACSITVEKVTDHGDKWQSETVKLDVAESFSLWFSGSDDDGQEALPGSSLTLSESFYQAIMESSLPLSSSVLRELQSVPMQIDIYVWLVHRMVRVRKETNVSWAQLEQQFGANYRRRRDFVRDFKKNLQEVRCYYPDSRVVVTDDGLILRRSPHHVAARRPSRGVAQRSAS